MPASESCRLPALAPKIVEAIMGGRQPKGLRLAEMLGNGPLAWEEQRGAWSFSGNSTPCAVGLAPAYRGEPSYYPQHERDRDGIACEPWSRR
jgi:hypothetical protein